MRGRFFSAALGVAFTAGSGFGGGALAQEMAAVAEGNAPADALADPVFQPVGKWRLSILEDGCSVTRDFEREGILATLSIKRIHPRAAVQFAVIGLPGVRDLDTLEAGFLPGAPALFDRVANASIGEREGVIFAGSLLPRGEDGQRLEPSQTTHFSVRGQSGDTVKLRTRAIDQAEAALDACVVEKLGDFGLDLADHDRIVSHAKPQDIKEWSQKLMRNYPKEAVRENWQGPVIMRLIIDESGRVAHCHVGNFLTAKVLRDAACEGMKEHARYIPATFADGTPAVDWVTQKVSFDLHGGSSRHFSADAHGFKIYED